MATNPLFLASFRGEQTIFVPAFAQRPRVLYTPGSLGSQVQGINIASTDASGTITLQLGIAQKKTLAGSMGTGAFIDGGGSDDSISRTTGSFVDDDWQVGDRALIGDATSLGNEFDALLTTVAASVLGLPTGTVAVAENFGATTFIARWAKGWRVAVPAGSGITAAAVSGMESADAPFFDGSPSRKLDLGPNDLLVGALDSTLLTGETIDVSVIAGDY